MTRILFQVEFCLYVYQMVIMKAKDCVRNLIHLGNRYISALMWVFQTALRLNVSISFKVFLTLVSAGQR